MPSEEPPFKEVFSLHNDSVRICTIIINVFHSCLSIFFPSVKVIISAALQETNIHAVDVFLALFGPEGRKILQPIWSHILSAPTFSTSDVTISHLHGSNTLTKEPKE